MRRTKRSVSALWKARASLTRTSKRLFYLTMVQSTLCYASNAFFPSITQGNFELLSRVSKSPVRATLGLPRWASTTPLYTSLNIRTLLHVFRQKIVQFVFCCLHGLASILFCQYFIPTTVWNQGRNMLAVPFSPGPSGHATMQFRGTLLWNSLPSTVREVTEYSLFCALVKVIRIDWNCNVQCSL